MPPVAAIDAGSNAIRLALVDVGPTGILVRRTMRRFALRLGADVFSTGAIRPERVAEVVGAFSEIARDMEAAGVARYRAVATSAMREAVNGPAIVDEIRRESGLELEIISGAEEGRIVRLTLMRALGTLPSDCLLVDLGGGSLELERTTDTGGCSLPLGTVRLLQRFEELKSPLGRVAFDRLYGRVRDELVGEVGTALPAVLAIGTGGNLDALARHLPLEDSAVAAIDLDRLRPFAQRLARMPAEERARRFDLRSDRADVVVPAALVILALAEVYGLEHFVVPGTGLRESLLYTLVTEGTRPSRARELLLSQSFELAGPDRCARIARRLFELTTALHQLWPPAAAPLEAAAYLLDPGAPDPERSVRRAVELLRSSPELDLEPRARVVAAHALSLATGVSVAVGRIGRRDASVAAVLGGILRLTAALALASDAWEPEVDLMRKPLRIRVGLREPLARAEVVAASRLFGRRVEVE